MSTHCLIGVIHGETIKTIYCHFDGYPKGVGSMLLKYYDSVKANHLVSLGELVIWKKKLSLQKALNTVLTNQQMALLCSTAAIVVKPT